MPRSLVESERHKGEEVPATPDLGSLPREMWKFIHRLGDAHNTALLESGVIS